MLPWLIGLCNLAVGLTCIVGGFGGDYSYYPAGPIGIPLSRSTECINNDGSWSYAPTLGVTNEWGYAPIQLGRVGCIAGGSVGGNTVLCSNGTIQAGWTISPNLIVKRDAPSTVYLGSSFVGLMGSFSGGSEFSALGYSGSQAAIGNANVNLGWGQDSAPSSTNSNIRFPAVVALNGTPCVMGGAQASNGVYTVPLGANPVSTSWCVTVASGVYSWFTGPSLTLARYGPSPITLPNGLTCVAGGQFGSNSYSNSVECAPSTSLWSSASFTVHPTFILPSALAVNGAVNITFAGMQCLAGGGSGSTGFGPSTLSNSVFCLNASMSLGGLQYNWLPMPSFSTGRTATMSLHIDTTTPTTAPTTGYPTLAPTRAPTLSPTSLAPSLSPTRSPTTSAPTTRAPTFAPTRSPTLSLEAVVVEVTFVFITPLNNTNLTDALSMANIYIAQMLVNLKIPQKKNADVQIQQANFTSTGELHVVLLVDSDVQSDVARAQGTTVLNAKVSIKWPTLIALAMRLPVWVPIAVAFSILALLIFILFLSKMLNRDAELIPLFAFLFHFCSMVLQIWAAYNLDTLSNQGDVSRSYFIAYLCFLATPLVPNGLALAALYRKVRHAPAARDWLKVPSHRAASLIVGFFAIPSNTRMVTLLYSGSFGVSGFSFPAEPIFRRLVQASSIMGLVFGEFPRSIVQIIVVIAKPTTLVAAAIGLPLCFSLIVLFYNTLLTCYHVAYAEKDFMRTKKPTFSILELK